MSNAAYRTLRTGKMSKRRYGYPDAWLNPATGKMVSPRSGIDMDHVERRTRWKLGIVDQMSEIMHDIDVTAAQAAMYNKRFGGAGDFPPKAASMIEWCPDRHARFRLDPKTMRVKMPFPKNKVGIAVMMGGLSIAARLHYICSFSEGVPALTLSDNKTCIGFSFGNLYLTYTNMRFDAHGSGVYAARAIVKRSFSNHVRNSMKHMFKYRTPAHGHRVWESIEHSAVMSLMAWLHSERAWTLTPGANPKLWPRRWRAGRVMTVSQHTQLIRYLALRKVLGDYIKINIKPDHKMPALPKRCVSIFSGVPLPYGPPALMGS